jgi:hypothetical protein
MPNHTRPIFQTLFENQLQLPVNQTCEQCDPDIKQPLLPWLVGDQFPQSPERVIFVGKPHRGTPGEILPSGIRDPTGVVEGYLWNQGWAYWSYTREIAERLYGSSAFDFIAFTNIIKCTNTHGTDNTTWTMAQNCLVKLQVIWQEFVTIEPFTVVFYTYGLYRQLLEKIPIAMPGSIREITTPNHRVPCGKKLLGWWERACATSWTSNMRILVIGHPERMNRPEYTELLVNWIRPIKGLQPTASNDSLA